MIWLILRRRRAPLVLVAVLVLVAAGLLAWLRASLLGDLARYGLLDCLQAPSPGCAEQGGAGFHEITEDWLDLLRALLVVVAPLLGVICGAGLHAGRPGDPGLVFTFSQASSRLRWWATTWLVGAGWAVVAVGVLTLVLAWALHPLSIFDRDWGIVAPRFDTTGIVPIGYALLAMALAATFGVLLRDHSAAVVATLVVWAAVFTLVASTRDDYLPSALATGPVWSASGAGNARMDGPGFEWGVIDARGNLVSHDMAYRGCRPSPADPDCSRWLEQHFVGRYARYRPERNYWPLQGIVTGLFAGLAVLVAGLGWPRVRTARRP